MDGASEDPGQDSAEEGEEPGPPRRWAGRIALITLVIVVIAVIAGTFAVKASPRKQDDAGYHSTAGSPSGDAKQLAAAFLRAWSSGDLSAAAGLTDNPSAARTALTADSRDLHLRKLTGTVTGASTLPAGGTGSGAAAATTLEAITFAVATTVAGSASSSAVSAAQRGTDDR